MQPLSFVASGAVVSEGQTVQSRELWFGNPARFHRKLTEVRSYVHPSPTFHVLVVVCIHHTIHDMWWTLVGFPFSST